MSENLKFPRSASTGMAALSPLLPLKRYVIFDQSGGSRRIFFDGSELRSNQVYFHETLALGIAAFEKAKDERSISRPLPLVDIDGCHRFLQRPENGIDVNSLCEEDPEELDALLSSDDDSDDDEASSTVTFSDGEETWSSSAESDYQSENKRKRSFSKANEDGDVEEESNNFQNSQNVGKRRRYNADEDGDLEGKSDAQSRTFSSGGEEEEESEAHWEEYRADRFKTKVNRLIRMVGGEFESKVDLLEKTIRLVKTLQQQVCTHILEA